MPAKLITYPEDNIIAIQFYGSGDAVEDTKQVRDLVTNHIKAHPGISTLYLITDVRDQKLNFGKLVQGMAEGMSNNVNDQYREMGVNPVGILVGSGQLLSLIMRFSGQDQYGRQKFIAFTSLEEAVSYARSDSEGRQVG